jgi:hypothetical protein
MLHLQSGRVLLVEGVAQREAEVINVIAQRVGPLVWGKERTLSALAVLLMHCGADRA